MIQEMVRFDATKNLLHFWWVEGVILREGELCNEHPIFKVGALVITFKHAKLQGVPKKMQHSDFSFRSVPEVQFNISTCVSESEF